MSSPDRPKATFSFVSLGCSKALIDSERMLGLLAQDGYRLVPESEAADLVIVNTCGFLESARAESLGVIREMVARKRAGEIRGVLVAGCLAERYKERIFEEVPGVDQVLGFFSREEVVRAADRVLGHLEEQRMLFRPAPVHAMDDRARLRITPRHFAYLKVSEGCDRACTFCSIPLMRGKHLSKPIEQVVSEAQELAADGTRELVLVAQDMTYYGLDLYGQPRLADLLRQLGQVEGIDWIRILYMYPQYFTDELFEVLSSTPRVIPYLDMPIQHINDRMLKLMNRRHSRAQTEEIIARLRSTIPGLVLRTTLIVGFPGETDQEFEELLEFVTSTRFERLGVFAYSYEPDTPSARLPDQIPEPVKEERRARILEAQQPIAFAFQRSLIGRTLDVLIDADSGRAPYRYIGRTYADAPDVDGIVSVSGRNLHPGDLISCEIVDADGYDLIAHTLTPPQPPRKRFISARQASSNPLRILPG
jgi:ribosomal protein S12 methylthiotransferase